MKFFIFTILIVISTTSYSQISNNELKRIRKKQSIEQIKELKKGTLLIRLKTSQKTIDALRAKGNEEKAKKVEENQLKFNKSLMKAFKDNFDFCEYYFFSSDYSSFLKNRKFDSVFYFNADLELDRNIKPKITTFFVSEYCPIESDTTILSGGFVQGTYGFEALIIRSDKFIQLARPFPYYVRTWDSWKKPSDVVSQMNKKLKKYYKKVNK